MYQVIVDGEPWVDSDGQFAYSYRAASSLADLIERQGYLDVTIAEYAAHVNYPHEPGRLYDCPACESKCHCDSDPGTTECVYDGVHITD